MGITILPEIAVINGALFSFSGSKFSSVHFGGKDIEITRLDLLNHLALGRLDVMSDGKSETLDAGSPLYEVIRSALGSMNDDIPNLSFTYDADGNIRSITTSEYSCLEFSSGRLSRSVSAEGVAVEYEFIEDAGEAIVLRASEANGIVRTYGSSGGLISIEIPGNGDESARLNFMDGRLSSLESSGAVLSDIVLDAGGEIESARLMNPEGNVYFFISGNLDDFIKDENINYELDPGTGRITSFNIVDTGEIFSAEYAFGPAGEEIITFLAPAEICSCNLSFVLYLPVHSTTMSIS